MAWNEIIGQSRVKSLLQKSISDNKLPSAWLFHGIDGIGKEALAIEFAKTVNCKSPIINGSEIESCGTCSSCKVFHTLSHPNLQIVFSLPAGKTSDSRTDNAASNLSDEQIQAIQEQLKLKSENYYHRISIPNASQIKISSIREVKRNLALTGGYQGRRCIVIIRAEEMTSEAANAFLKTLEEPSANVSLILITSKPQSLPITILSRCQHVACEPISDEILSKALVDRHGLAESEAMLISSFAQGSYIAALQFLDEDMRKLRFESVELLRSALKKTNFRVELLANIEKLTSGKDKIKLEAAINLLLLWLRDALALSVGSKNKLMNIDQADVLSRFSERYSNCDLPKSILVTETAVTHVRRNVNPQLILLNLFLELREIFVN